MNELNNQSTALSSEQQISPIHWKRKRKFQQKLVAFTVLLFELTFVGTCAYYIVRNIL